MAIDPMQADELAALSQRGDREAFHRLFEAYYRPLRIVVALRAADEELTDEVVQESFVAAFENISGYEPRGTFFPWLVGIARNRLATALRARAATGHLSDHLRECLVAEVADDASANENQGWEIVQRVERVRRCLERMTPMARNLAHWRFAERRTVSAISAELGRSAASISVSLHRIRSALRACLDGKDPDV